VSVCEDGLLYGVTGPTGVLMPQGFTIDLVEDERYTVDIIATWSPDDKVFLITSLIRPVSNKPLLSLIPWLSTRRCPHVLLSTAPAVDIKRLLSSKPAAC